MKSNELRIGNWVKHNPDQLPKYANYGNFQVESTDNIGRIGIGIHYRREEDILPIPLTEEWLERFGFEKMYDDSWSIKVDGCRLSVEPDDGSFCLYNTDEDFRRGRYPAFGDDSRCRHVHQLQNLYFALTGAELTIKEL